MMLNDEQIKAINHKDGPCIVTSVPGSGKTSVITHRVANLVKKGVDSGNILCLTFTNKAANEMKDRISKMVSSTSPIWISTFHSFCIAILRKYGHLVGLEPSFSIYDENDQKELLTKIGRMNEVIVDRGNVYNLISAINKSRENLEPIDDYCNNIKDNEKQVLVEYLKTLDEFNAVDFSGCLFKTYELLKSQPKVVDVLANKFKYILGDEWQDTNTIQYEITKLIAQKHQNLFVVGDISQCIFAFRCANPENINKIRKDFPNTTNIVLNKNYRSTSHILNYAERLIRNNKESSDTTLISVKGNGEKVLINAFPSQDYESKSIAERISFLKLSNNQKWSDFAILYRTNALSRMIEVTLRTANIPYRIQGGFSFFDRAEIKTALSYLSVLANPSDTIAFSRAISNPKRGIGDVLIGKMEKMAHQKSIPVLNSAEELLEGVSKTAQKSLSEFIAVINKHRNRCNEGEPIDKIAVDVMNDSGYYLFLKKESEKDQDYQKRVDNLDEFLLSISEFVAEKPSCSMGEYLQSIEIMKSNNSDEDTDAVNLTTIHSAKGLEFENTFIIGCEDGIIPHTMSIVENAIDEERRLMYVACTRGKSRLVMSYCKYRKNLKTGKLTPCKPSRFLAEMCKEI